MKINSFKCPQCGEFTRHVEITTREVCAISDDGTAMELLGGVADLVGFRHLTRNLTGDVPYKCCKCGRCAWRTSSGEEPSYSYIGYSK